MQKADHREDKEYRSPSTQAHGLHVVLPELASGWTAIRFDIHFAVTSEKSGTVLLARNRNPIVNIIMVSSSQKYEEAMLAK